MSHPLKSRHWRLALLVLLLAAAPAMADSGKELFGSKCSGCHSIGGGDGGGPDLKGVGSRRTQEWLVKLITAPDKLAAEKDPTQVELVKKYGSTMPNLGVSADDAQKIASFLKESGDGAAASGASEQPKAPVVVTKELVAAGTALFTGKTLFAKGGPPCVSCHTLSGVHGGVLGADLTGIYGKMGENGVQGVLKGLSFPIMKKAYEDRPLTEDEMTALTALFSDASKRQEHTDTPYPAAGLGVFAVLLIGAVIYHRRIS